jgi:uncharacterized integral membrane protein
MPLLRLFSKLMWVLVFLAMLLFAIKNADPVPLYFYFDQRWESPLIVVVLVAIAAGSIFGLLACLSPIVRLRREIGGLTREIRLRDKAGVDPSPVALQSQANEIDSEIPPLS